MRRIQILLLIAAAAAPLPAADPAEDGADQNATGHHDPKMSPDAKKVKHDPSLFGPDPSYEDKPYDPDAQLDIYGSKYLNTTQRPLLEWGRELYQFGPFRDTPDWFGPRNPAQPQLLVYGDYRTAVAYNDNGAAEQARWAHRLNLEVDLRLTATERVHAFFRPFDQNGNFTRVDFGGENHNAQSEFDADPDALFFEGEIGTILGGTGTQLDIPFAAGLMPLLFQNGVWMEDAFTGLAFTIPAQNSPAWDISNMDLTFFVGLDDITTPAFAGDDHGARFYGIATFLEANEGYWEIDYAYVQDKRNLGRGYHNASIAFTRRYGGWLNNSVRLVTNFGQDPVAGPQTADGQMILIENSFVTPKPLTVVPYLNFFAGFDRPQSLARDAGAGGILKNTGILFESDGLTGYPTLDATGQQAWGLAAGINVIGDHFEDQLVFEAAMVKPHDTGAIAAGHQFGLGVRYQKPINHAMILRADAMVGFLDNAENLSGVRLEFRWKF
ncbi:MAG: hypothetical protein R3236_08510 [Phycisphaeraceae bacterium]|nr:hypothetical protein [Phycisphaeraceae bacterium]